MKENKLPDGAVIVEELDNSEWAAGVEKGKKILAERAKKGKTFVMLDKNKSATKNLEILKRAAKQK
jgi:hypothetical protein